MPYVHFNGNSFSQFGTNGNSSAVRMGPNINLQHLPLLLKYVFMQVQIPAMHSALESRHLSSVRHGSPSPTLATAMEKKSELYINKENTPRMPEVNKVPSLSKIGKQHSDSKTLNAFCFHQSCRPFVLLWGMRLKPSLVIH